MWFTLLAMALDVFFFEFSYIVSWDFHGALIIICSASDYSLCLRFKCNWIECIFIDLNLIWNEFYSFNSKWFDIFIISDHPAIVSVIPIASHINVSVKTFGCCCCLLPSHTDIHTSIKDKFPVISVFLHISVLVIKCSSVFGNLIFCGLFFFCLLVYFFEAWSVCFIIEKFYRKCFHHSRTIRLDRKKRWTIQKVSLSISIWFLWILFYSKVKIYIFLKLITNISLTNQCFCLMCFIVIVTGFSVVIIFEC